LIQPLADWEDRDDLPDDGWVWKVIGDQGNQHVLALRPDFPVPATA
jgi:hypothetical protein